MSVRQGRIDGGFDDISEATSDNHSIERPPDLTIISLGAGVQSSTMALMSAMGELPAIDAAIFADTGWEPREVMLWLDKMEEMLPFPVYRVMSGDGLRKLTLNPTSADQFVYFPVYVKKANGKKGIGRRICTREFKVAPIVKKMRDLLGLKPGQRAKGRFIVEQWLGITTDEAMRMKPSPPRLSWIRNRWPLIEKGMSRKDCQKWLFEKGFGKVPKSSCIICPYRSNKSWREMKMNSPREWVEACEADTVIRSSSSTPGGAYIHGSLKPLESADLRDHGTQLNLWNNECDGICGT